VLQEGPEFVGGFAGAHRKISKNGADNGKND
jgi:hypothetical protein